MVGLAGAAASVYLLIRSANESSPQPAASTASSWTILPGVGPGQAGLVLRAQF